MKYSRTYEYILAEGDFGTVGISEEASDKMGDICFVELPQVGSKISKDSEAGVIESVKAASDIFIPVSGEVTEVNELLSQNPQLVSSSPLDKGWLFKIKILNKKELDLLMDADAFKKFVNEEGH